MFNWCKSSRTNYRQDPQLNNRVYTTKLFTLVIVSKLVYWLFSVSSEVCLDRDWRSDNGKHTILLVYCKKNFTTGPLNFGVLDIWKILWENVFRNNSFKFWVSIYKTFFQLPIYFILPSCKHLINFLKTSYVLIWTTYEPLMNRLWASYTFPMNFL